MRAKALVPFLPGCPHRARVFRYVRDRLPGTPLVSVGTPPWCKGAVVNRGVRYCTAEVIAVVDADVLIDLEPAIRAVESGRPWAVPHTRVLRLSEDATERVLAGEDPKGQRLEQRPYVGVVGGGALVARREVLLDVPMDERFVGWGQEDESFGMALKTLYGRPWRGDQDLIHLWHPPQERMDRKRGSPEEYALRQRYSKSRNPEAMRALVEEAKDFADAANQP